MGKHLVIASLLILILSCGKDKFESRPQLELKSVSATVVQPFTSLQIIYRLTDKEGDFRKNIWYQKVTTRCPSSNTPPDSLLFAMPDDLPRKANFDGETILTLDWALTLQPKCVRNDTAVFSIWMKDDKGNVSDTLKTPPIIIIRP